MKHIAVTITARKNYNPDFHNSINNFTYKIDTHDHVFILGEQQAQHGTN